MNLPFTNLVAPFILVAIGGGFAAAGFYVGQTDDSPGAALIGLVVMASMVALAIRLARRKR